MQKLSALDAISPAFARTKLVLFSPFRKGRTWKLAATAYLTMAGSAFLPWPLVYLVAIPIFSHAPDASPDVTKAMGYILAGFAVVATLIYAVLFYICSRLRFAFFDIVLNNGQFVAPAWRKYGSASLKWTLFKLLIGSAVAAVLAWPIWHTVQGLGSTFQALNVAPGQPPSPEFMRGIFSLYAAFFAVYLVVGLYMWAHSIVSDFVVPTLALEDTTLAEAFRRLGVLIRDEPGEVALYAVMKLALALAAFMAAGIAFYLVLLAVVLVAVIVFGILGFLLYLAHVPVAVLTVLGFLVAAALYFMVFFYGIVIANGTAVTFLESYLLYFLGGRYPQLGALLTASTPLPEPFPPQSSGPHPPFPPAPTAAPLPPA